MPNESSDNFIVLQARWKPCDWTLPMWRQSAARSELGKGVGKDGWRQQER